MFLKLFSRSRPEPDDLELVRQYRESGDLELVGRLFERYTEMVYLICYKYFRDEDESKDAAMQIFEGLTATLRKHEVHHFKSWLHVTAKNFCLMQLRRRENKIIRREEDLSALSDMQNGQDGHHEATELEADLTLLEKGLEYLPPEQRTCVELFYLQEKSYKEIAGLTGLDLNKVRSHIQNGRRNLKIYFEKHHEAH